MKSTAKKEVEKNQPALTLCLCAALRQASRAVTRIYDAELRETGLRTTQHAVLRLLDRVGEVRQSDLGDLASLDQTTLSRSLPPLEQRGWLTIRAGADRREKLVAITSAGRKKLEQSRPAWNRAQKEMQRILPNGTWDSLFVALPTVAQAAAKLEPGD